MTPESEFLLRCHRTHKNSAQLNYLQPNETDEALTRWVKLAQESHYHKEIASLKAHRFIRHKSSLKQLSPYLDELEVLRVGGRLKHSILSRDEQHPIILPPDSQLTLLLVEAHHKRTLYGGVQLTLGTLRQKFWILRGRSTVKRVIHRCITCTRWRATSPQPPMGNLPRDRVTPARPFLKVGVDYAGPIPIRCSPGRGQRASKGYIAVFVCFCTKAVHLEAVSDCSTNAFLAALRRFTSRRGLCSDIYSDCGTNFVRTDRALRDLFRASTPDGQRIELAATSLSIKWHFNPPSAPHFGGLWEAAVKSVKHHLKRVIGDSTLTFEEMSIRRRDISSRGHRHSDYHPSGNSKKQSRPSKTSVIATARVVCRSSSHQTNQPHTRRSEFDCSSCLALVRLKGHSQLDPWPCVSLENVRRQPSVLHPGATARRSLEPRSRKGKPCRLRFQRHRATRAQGSPTVVDRTTLASASSGNMAKIQSGASRRRTARETTHLLHYHCSRDARIRISAPILHLTPLDPRHCLVPQVASPNTQ